jgi:hypothetical protein
VAAKTDQSDGAAHDLVEPHKTNDLKFKPRNSEVKPAGASQH